MTGAETLMAAALGGVLTSASPCTLAAVPVALGFVGGQGATPGRSLRLALAFVVGMNLALLGMGLAAARLGVLAGVSSGAFSAALGTLLIAVAGLLWMRPGRCLTLPLHWQQRLAGSGIWGALVLGALTGTVMSPCATPALALALTVAGAGGAFSASTLWGAALLLAYGLGRSVLVLIAGSAPGAATLLIRRLGQAQAWLPGPRMFAGLLAIAGLWWLWQGLEWAHGN